MSLTEHFQRHAAAGSWALLFLLIFASFETSAQESTQAPSIEILNGREVVAGQALVKFRDAAAPERLLKGAEATDAMTVREVGRVGLLLIESKGSSVSSLLEELSKRADVVYAEPNYIVRIDQTPNDPYFSILWGFHNTSFPSASINARSAWDISTGSTGNVVAVIDTGVDYNHADLAGNMWSAPASFTVNIGGQTITCGAGTHGFNAITRTCNPADDHGHGTHVAGTIGAVGNNGLGVTGVNWTAGIMGLKFIGANGTGTVADAINAIEFAIQAKQRFGAAANVRILSNSWGGDGFSQALSDQVNRANSNDMLFVAAAGNGGSDNDITPFYPANLGASNVISVAATDNQDNRAGFSNYGRNHVHLGAPGLSIYSTTAGGGYGYSSGTSMATPHVSGAAALVLSRCTLNTANLKSIILNNVDQVSSMSGITITGGRLNVNKAIRACSAPAYSVAASPNSISSGGTITVNWSSPAGHSTTDWVGLYKAGGPDVRFLAWQYTGGGTAGSMSFATPVQTGQYEFRYYVDNGYTRVATSNTITVTASAYTLTASPSTVLGGAAVTLNWSAPIVHSSVDWVGLYQVGASDTSFISWRHTGDAVSGQMSFTAPPQAGQYEFRYYVNNSYTRAATSNAVSVSGSAYSVSVSTASVSVGGTINASWAAPADHSSVDWIGLYAVGASDTNFISWQFTGAASSGQMAFTAPSQAGQYELRYFINNSYNRMTTSNMITVQ